MKRFVIAFSLLLFLCPVVFGQSTDIFLHPDVWLRADQQNNTTNYWQDVSGNQRNAFLTPGNIFPAASILNFNPCFSFDGNTAPFRVSYDFEKISGMTVIVVYQTSDFTLEKGVWAVLKDTSKPQRLTSQRIEGETFSIKYRNKNDTIGIVNSFSFSWNDSHVDSIIDIFYLGGTDSMAFQGKIAECLIYPQILKGKDLTIINSYLCLKYGASLMGLNYLNAVGDTLWNNHLNKGFDDL